MTTSGCRVAAMPAQRDEQLVLQRTVNDTRDAKNCVVGVSDCMQAFTRQKTGPDHLLTSEVSHKKRQTKSERFLELVYVVLGPIHIGPKIGFPGVKVLIVVTL